MKISVIDYEFPETLSGIDADWLTASVQYVRDSQLLAETSGPIFRASSVEKFKNQLGALLADPNGSTRAELVDDEPNLRIVVLPLNDREVHVEAQIDTGIINGQHMFGDAKSYEDIVSLVELDETLQQLEGVCAKFSVRDESI